MKKPARLELNRSGSWKLLGVFDAAVEDATDEIMNAAEKLAQALNDPAAGGRNGVSLRISNDDQVALMYWTAERDGWFDAKTMEAV